MDILTKIENKEKPFDEMPIETLVIDSMTALADFLLVEAMAQVAGVLILSNRLNLGKRAYFMSIDRVKFRRMVLPGDQLNIEVSVLKLKTRTGQVYARALVDDKLVSEAYLMFSLGDK